MDIEKSREYVVAKHNELIQRARYRLSVQQQKVLLHLISKVKPHDLENTKYSLSIKEYCEICGIDEKNGANYIYVKRSLEEIDQQCTWLKADGIHTRMRWFDTLQICENSGTIEVTFHSSVTPYLFLLSERYTQYKLISVLPMRSKYGVRLYEILQSYRMMHKKEFGIEELKELIDAQIYDKGYDLKRKAIDPAVEEINLYTNLQVSYTLEKTGKKYDRITFIIRENNRIQELSAKYAKRDALSRKKRNTKQSES